MFVCALSLKSSFSWFIVIISTLRISDFVGLNLMRHILSGIHCLSLKRNFPSFVSLWIIIIFLIAPFRSKLSIISGSSFKFSMIRSKLSLTNSSWPVVYRNFLRFIVSLILSFIIELSLSRLILQFLLCLRWLKFIRRVKLIICTLHELRVIVSLLIMMFAFFLFQGSSLVANVISMIASLCLKTGGMLFWAVMLP